MLEEYILEGKVAVVTGSGKGIGRGIAQNIYMDGGLTAAV